MYSTEADVRAELKADLLTQLVRGEAVASPEEAQAKITEMIVRAVEDADAEINGYLAKSYTVPLAKVPQVIAKYAKDIAVYNLISRIGVGKDDDRENNYYRRYQAALRFLELVAKGTVELGMKQPGQQSASGFRMSGPERLFSRDHLRGM